MKGNRFLLATGVGFVAMFALGSVWHLLLFGEFYREQIAAIARTEMLLPLIVIAEVLRAALLAYIYPIGYKDGSAIMEGGRFGIAMGLFTALAALVYFASYQHTSIAWFWVEGAFWVIQGAAGGVVIAWVHGARTGKGTQASLPSQV